MAKLTAKQQRDLVLKGQRKARKTMDAIQARVKKNKAKKKKNTK